MLIKKPDKYVNYFVIGSIWLQTDHEIFLGLKALLDKLGLNSQLDFYHLSKGLKSVVYRKFACRIYTLADKKLYRENHRISTEAYWH